MIKDYRDWLGIVGMMVALVAVVFVAMVVRGILQAK
jgi:hypothetical protein